MSMAPKATCELTTALHPMDDMTGLSLVANAWHCLRVALVSGSQYFHEAQVNRAHNSSGRLSHTGHAATRQLIGILWAASHHPNADTNQTNAAESASAAIAASV